VAIIPFREVAMNRDVFIGSLVFVILNVV